MEGRNRGLTLPLPLYWSDRVKQSGSDPNQVSSENVSEALQHEPTWLGFNTVKFERKELSWYSDLGSFRISASVPALRDVAPCRFASNYA